jgi:hypothetical protein
MKSISVQACVAALIERYAPATVLVIGDPAVMPEAAAQSFRLPVADAPAQLAGLGRFDFAVASGLAEALEPAVAEALIGRLKNLHTDRFVLLVDPAKSRLGHDALLALALAPFEHLDDGRVAWRYDIDLYNPERRWNNPEDWANPQNFGKFRW